MNWLPDAGNFELLRAKLVNNKLLLCANLRFKRSKGKVCKIIEIYIKIVKIRMSAKCVCRENSLPEYRRKCGLNNIVANNETYSCDH